MHSILPSQITQLLYIGEPNLNFAHVVTDLCDVFTPVNGPAPHLQWDCDDIALLDLPNARIVIGFSENIPGPHATCVTVAIGQSPRAGTAVLDHAAQSDLSQQIAALINQRSQSDAQQSQTIDQPLTPDLIDQLVDRLFQPLATASGNPEVATVPDLSADPTPQSQSPEHSDMDRLMRRLSSELVARAPNIISRAIASAAPKARKLVEPLPQKNSTALGDTPTSQNAAVSKPGLFWTKAKRGGAQVHDNNTISEKTQTRKISSGELKAVRDALYASDVSRPDGPQRIAAQTRRVLKTLTDLSHSLSGATTQKGRTIAAAPKDGIKH